MWFFEYVGLIEVNCVDMLGFQSTRDGVLTKFRGSFFLSIGQILSMDFCD